MTPLDGITRKHVVSSTERRVYLGCILAGVYVRIGIRFYAAFDEHGVWLGDRKRPSRARSLILRQQELKDASHTSVKARSNLDQPNLTLAGS